MRLTRASSVIVRAVFIFFSFLPFVVLRLFCGLRHAVEKPWDFWGKLRGKEGGETLLQNQAVGFAVECNAAESGKDTIAQQARLACEDRRVVHHGRQCLERDRADAHCALNC